MIVTGKKAIYDAFGLCISSEIELPELLEAENSKAFADVEIELAKPEFTWPILEQTQDHYVVHGAKLFLYSRGRKLLHSRGQTDYCGAMRKHG